MQNKKILFLLNYASKSTRNFEINSMARASYLAAKQMGYEFHMNTNSEEVKEKNADPDIHYHVIGIYRSPLSQDTWNAYKKLKILLKEEHFDIIHCNTPIGGALGRLCGKKARQTKVIYQAHGFHFYKGAPFLNWMLYFPIERYLAHATDLLITINREDYQIAQKFKLRAHGKTYYMPGVGIDTERYQKPLCDRVLKREQLGIAPADFVLLSAGRLDQNKNNAVVIKALAKLKIPAVHFLLCGEGEERERLEAMSEELGIKQQVHFLGNRTDMVELYKAADVFVMMSYREGLPRSVMEAMASGLPCIVSRIRGNVDLIDEALGGYLVPPDDAEQLSERLRKMYEDETGCIQMGEYNREHADVYDINGIVNKTVEIYKEILR